MPAPDPSPLVRAVVVTWNGAHLLPACLDSLDAQHLRDRTEVVVVDNASTDGTDELLAARPGTTVVRAPRNLGFAGGVDLGLRDVRAPFVLLLNNDAALAPDGLDALLAELTAPGNERVAAATAKVVLRERDAQGRTLVNSTGNVLTPWGAGVDRDWLSVDGTQSPSGEVFGFHGGAALLRTEAVRAVGGIDPWLFLYYEDTDLSWRLRAAGWTVRYVETAVAEHAHAASSDPASALFRYYNTRNSLVVVTRHAPVGMVVRSFARQAAGTVRALVRTGWDPTTRARARGLGAWALRLPRTLRERRATWHDAAVRRRDVATVALSAAGSTGAARPGA